LLRCSVRAVGGSGAQPPYIGGFRLGCQPRSTADLVGRERFPSPAGGSVPVAAAGPVGCPSCQCPDVAEGRPRAVRRFIPGPASRRPGAPFRSVARGRTLPARRGAVKSAPARSLTAGTFPPGSRMPGPARSGGGLRSGFPAPGG